MVVKGKFIRRVLTELLDPFIDPESVLGESIYDPESYYQPAKKDLNLMDYKKFCGRNYYHMPLLIAEGRVPMSVSQLMQRRLDVKNADDSLKNFWMDNYFDTGDAVIYHPDGRVKIVLDSQYLRDMSWKNKRSFGALVLTEDDYKAMEGEEFKKEKLGKVSNSLSKIDVKTHPVWKVLSRDQSLLNDYTDHIFSEVKEKFDYDRAMGIYPNSSAKIYDVEMKNWEVDGLMRASGAHNAYSIDYVFGRLVGIKPNK